MKTNFLVSALLLTTVLFTSCEKSDSVNPIDPYKRDIVLAMKYNSLGRFEVIIDPSLSIPYRHQVRLEYNNHKEDVFLNLRQGDKITVRALGYSDLFIYVDSDANQYTGFSGNRRGYEYSLMFPGNQVTTHIIK
jgi:hypothetical protein